MKRGDIVVIDFPFVTGNSGKKRPALVIQTDRDNQRLTNTIVAMISGNTRHAGEPTQVFVDPSAPEGISSGLHAKSAVKCSNLFTVEQQDVIKTIGMLSSLLMNQVDLSLKTALDLP